ncbi:MAG: carbamoyltransferase HypF [Actinomycetota bacterium]
MAGVRRARVHVSGIVQGVGFRPYVFNVASDLGLVGWVRNDSDGLTAEIEGNVDRVGEFLSMLTSRPPPLAVIEDIGVTDLAPRDEREFLILHSEPGERNVPVSPDVATCEDCAREISAVGDRRHGYAFTNCTNCGPRYTIVRDVPYDRAETTMSEFSMCSTCVAEYENPTDRRFHAQPNACPECGPRLRLFDAGGEALGGDPIAGAARLLRAGAIVAVKGLGGYHLACDAADEGVVARLRGRKHRDERPFALMARRIAEVRELCALGPEEEALLISRRRPIVIARRNGDRVAPSVAPGYGTLGVMLPYTPLHHLLLAAVDRVLVMTSGNVSDEPIAFVDQEARARLGGIADAFLVHDRAIEVRCDDSVARVVAGRAGVIRRSRGYVPEPLRLPVRAPVGILAAGAQLKNTVAVAKGGMCVPSHHIGDLENLETLRSFEHAIGHLSRLFDVRVEAVAHDLHPEYLSTKWALEQPHERIPVQHHHAHVASCLAENSRTDPVIGVAFDGLGYGDDGTLWGGEFLVADLLGYRRVAHLDTVPMPGGHQAIRQPWRMAAVWLARAFGDAAPHAGRLAEVSDERRQTCLAMAAQGLNAPVTSSMGRLFDAVAAIAGVRNEVSYEAQAAIEFEEIATPGPHKPYEFVYRRPEGTWIVDPTPCVREAARDADGGVAVGVISGRFHLGVARMIVDVCSRLRDDGAPSITALSGGVFQNALLVETVVPRLLDAGFEVLTHQRVPANDGGISLGQAAVAAAVLARRAAGQS